MVFRLPQNAFVGQKKLKLDIFTYGQKEITHPPDSDFSKIYIYLCKWS